MKVLQQATLVAAAVVVLALVGCETATREAAETMLTGTYDTSVTIGRAQVRDAVRDGAILPNGKPLFSRIETDYRFQGDRFVVNGVYIAPDGSEQAGTIVLVFDVAGGQLRATLVEHTLQGLSAEIPAALEEGIAGRLATDITGTMSEEIVRFLDVSPEGSNMLTVRLRLADARDDMVIPLDTQ